MKLQDYLRVLNMDYNWVKDRIAYGVLGAFSGAEYGLLIHISRKQKLILKNKVGP